MKLLIAISSALINLCAFSFIGADELRFEGKSMETWLKNLIGIPDGNDQFPREETRRQAVKAFKRMGSREYEYLIDLIPSDPENLHGIIRAAFQVAGTHASPVIPKLIALFDRGDEQIDGLAGECLI